MANRNNNNPDLINWNFDTKPRYQGAKSTLEDFETTGIKQAKKIIKTSSSFGRSKFGLSWMVLSGDSAQPPIVIIGTFGSLLRWNRPATILRSYHLQNALAAETNKPKRTVITIVAPNSSTFRKLGKKGRKQLKNGDFSSLADLHVKTIRLLTSEPFDLFGFSQGARIAVAIAAKQPASVLRLVAGDPPGARNLGTWEIIKRFNNEQKNAQGIIRHDFGEPTRLTKWRIIFQALSNLKSSYLLAQSQSKDTIKNELRALLATSRSPITIAVGTKSQLANINDYTKLLNDNNNCQFSLISIAGANHVWHLKTSLLLDFQLFGLLYTDLE